MDCDFKHPRQRQMDDRKEIFVQRLQKLVDELIRLSAKQLSDVRADPMFDNIANECGLLLLESIANRADVAEFEFSDGGLASAGWRFVYRDGDGTVLGTMVVD